MSQVHKHSHSVLEHCVCLLPLFFAVLVRTQITIFFHQNEPQNISLESVAMDNPFWVGCTSLRIVYKNIEFASYNFFVHMVEE